MMNSIYLITIILGFFFWLIFVELLKPRYLLLLIIVAAAFLSIKTFFFQPFKIPTTSMVPTLLAGDQILVNKLYYTSHDPLPGDVILFELPRNPRQTFIKRIVGKPGDQIKINTKILFVNGKAILEPYAINKDPQIIPEQAQPRDYFGPVIVPEGHLFLLGDNRDFSSDSRFWGCLPIRGVKGKVSTIYWSYDNEQRKIRWSRIGNRVK